MANPNQPCPECDSCGAENPVGQMNKVKEDGEEWVYCDLCWGTYASKAHRHGHKDQLVLQAICYVGNAILARLRKDSEVTE